MSKTKLKINHCPRHQCFLSGLSLLAEGFFIIHGLRHVDGTTRFIIKV